MKNKKIFIATGGTGGHIIPARVVAQKLALENHQVFILADKKYRSYIKLEDQFSSIIISSSQADKSIVGAFFMLIKIALGFLQSLFYFLLHRPDFVISFGGYATFPILVAAIITRTKIILHEQNAHLGKVNRIFASKAFKIALTFEETAGIKSKYTEKLVITGNPVREEILQLHNREYKLPTKSQYPSYNKMGYDVLLARELDDYFDDEKDHETFNILVIGGSGGAKIFSEILPKAFFNLSDDIKNRLHILQQCRSDLAQSTFDQYKKFNLNIIVAPFFDDMVSILKSVHLVIARAGSSSIAEFCAAKKPMILIPFAKAADDHQAKNAKIIENKRAALVISETEFTISGVSEILKDLIGNEDKLKLMSQMAAMEANLKAADNLIAIIKL